MRQYLDHPAFTRSMGLILAAVYAPVIWGGVSWRLTSWINTSVKIFLQVRQSDHRFMKIWTNQVFL